MTVILQISSGQGPMECRKFVPLLADRIMEDVLKEGLAINPLTEYLTDRPIPSVRFTISGEKLDSFKREWSGTVQWIWKSTIRPSWPRKNWFVKVSFFEFQNDSARSFRSDEIRIDTYRSSGHGGQHVNTTDSAVRVVHLPTGTVCTATEERSQIRNRELALLRLKEKLNLISEQMGSNQDEQMWLDHYHLERGRPVKIFRDLPIH